MASLAQKKEEAKKEIRSLLLSAPVGLTVQELKRDYFLYIGRKLPSEELGYRSAKEFLMDIPDTVEVTRRNGTVVLTGLPDSSTEHIQRLVASQKLDARKHWGTVSIDRNHPTCGTAARRGRNSTVHPWRASHISVHERRCQEAPPRLSGQRGSAAIPSVIPRTVREIVRFYSDGIPLTHFCAIYRRHCGYTLDPYILGFANIKDLLASMPNIVVLKQLSAGEIWVMSVEADLLKEESWRHQRQYHTFDDPASNGQTNGIPQNSGALESLTADVVDNEHSLGDSAPAGEVTRAGTQVPDGGTSCNIPAFLQNNIKSVMEGRPKGIYASRLPFEYKDKFKEELPHRAYGYNSVVEFVSDLPHIIRVERPDPLGDWHLLPATADSHTDVSDNAASRQQSKEKTVSNIQVDESTREAVSQVLSTHIDGVPLQDFHQTYQRMTGEDLDVSKYGAGDLKQFLHSMSDMLVISLDVSDKPVVRLKDCERPRKFDKLQGLYKPFIEQTEDSFLHLPIDAVGLGCSYKPQNLPQFGSEPKFIELFVSNIITPAMFWIQLRGPETTLALEDLMDEMEKVYSQKHLSQVYHLTPELAKCGLVCVAIYPQDGFWYRAVITSIRDQLFQVFYVDYGNSCLVSITQMRLLKTKFVKLPAQAVQARLSNISPAAGGVWGVSSKNRFLALTREKPLVGLVTSLKDGVLSLCLTDTWQEQDVHINDVLVEEGHALFLPDTEALESVDHSQVPNVGLIYGDKRSMIGRDDVSPHPSEVSTKRYVRQAQMTDEVVMNLINLEGELHLLSSEISRLFFTEDILSAQLFQDNVDVPKKVLMKKDKDDLFKELVEYGAQNVTDSTNAISLYPLAVLPLMVELYDNQNKFEEVKETTQEILHWFDPDDSYWKGQGMDDVSVSEGTENNSRSFVAGSSDLPSLHDLQLALNSLNVRRNRILNRMLTDTSCSVQSVNELNEVELNMKRVETAIAKLQTKSEQSADSQPAQRSQQGKGKSKQAQNELCHLPETIAVSQACKSTQKVAPIIQTCAAKQQTPAIASSPADASSQIVSNVSVLLEQQIALSKVLTEQLRMSQALACQFPQQSCPKADLQPGNTAASSPNPLLSLGICESRLPPDEQLLKGQQKQQRNSDLDARLAALSLYTALQASLLSSQLPEAISSAGVVLPGGHGGLQQQMCQNWQSQRHPVTSVTHPGHPVVSVTHPGHPATSMTHPGHPVTSVTHPGHPVTSMTQPGHPVTSMTHPGHPATSVTHPGHPATYVTHPGHPATSMTQPGHPATYVTHPGHPATSMTHPGHPATSMTHPGHPATSMTHPGHPATYVTHPGHPATSMTHPGHPATSMTHPGHPATSMTHPGHPATSMTHPGHPATSMTHPGHPATYVTHPNINLRLGQIFPSFTPLFGASTAGNVSCGWTGCSLQQKQSPGKPQI